MPDHAARERLFEVVFVVADAIGLALGAWLLWRRSPRTAELLRDAGVACRFALGWLAVCTLPMLVLFHSMFGALSAAVHAIVFVVAPLALARGTARLVWARRADGLVGIAVGASIVGVYCWAHFVEPYRLTIDSHRILTPHAVAVSHPIRVALLADIQTDRIGMWEKQVFDTVAEQQPDLLLLAGDYIQVADRDRFAVECRKFRDLVDGMRPWPRLGVFAVIGDIDPDPTILDGTRVRMLRDETVIVDRERRLQLIGLGLAASRTPLSRDVAARIAAFDGYTIVLGHAPDYAIPVIDGSLPVEALLLAGHTHGGQVVIPGFGPPTTLSRVPRAVAAGGLHEFGDARVCVSRGIGMERGVAPRVRLFCRPQIVIFEIGTDS